MTRLRGRWVSYRSRDARCATSCVRWQARLRCLLVVDNCEHAVAEAAEIVADLLTAGGPLRVLATSREPLGVPGEVSYQVQTLPVPAQRDSCRAADAGNYDAVRLFVDRAATASPGFTLTDAIAPAVAALCERLDGLPLAIELAASRVRSFGPAELVEHLDQRFELLSAGARTAVPRHRTLRGAIDWSYELLDDDERALFDRLGVFPADFDYEAVRSVYGPDDPGGGAVMTLLPRLVDKSLVSAVGRGTRRYRLLETIRTYAAEQAGGLRHRDRRQAAARRPLPCAGRASRPAAAHPRPAGLARPADHRAAEPAGRAGPQHHHRRHRVRLAVGRRAAAVLGTHRAAPRGSRVDPAGAGDQRPARHPRGRRRTRRGQHDPASLGYPRPLSSWPSRRRGSLPIWTTSPAPRPRSRSG